MAISGFAKQHLFLFSFLIFQFVTKRMLRPRMDNPATQSVLMMTNPEYNREEVRNALIHNIRVYNMDQCIKLV